MYTALDHQLQDGLMDQQEFDRTRFIAEVEIIFFILGTYFPSNIISANFCSKCMGSNKTKGVPKSIFRTSQQRLEDLFTDNDPSKQVVQRTPVND